MLRGIGGAFGESLGLEWFAAICDSDDEAAAQFNRHQAHAALNRMRDRNGSVHGGDMSDGDFGGLS